MSTVSLRVLCEGRTEVNFVTQVLRPHLREHAVFVTAALLSPGGGVVTWRVMYRSIKHEIGRLRDHEYVTTMIDLYALPGDYPDAGPIGNERGVKRATRIADGMARELHNSRFVPYVQVHEFEALLFVDLDAIPSQFPDGEAADAPAQLRRAIGDLGPEDIDDGVDTAPSKRVAQQVPAYSKLKAIAGPAIAARIGLARLRQACPHFDQWVTRLEQLGCTGRAP